MLRQVAFMSPLPLHHPLRPGRSTCPAHIPPTAKKSSNNRRSKKAQSSRRSRNSKSSTSSKTPIPPPSPLVSPPVSGPLAPELPDDVVSNVEIPAPDESKLRLPELGIPRRKRKPIEGETTVVKKASKEEKNEDALSTSAIKRLTKAYREGGTQAEEVISKIERDPDFMFQTGNATGEYDLASAIIGTGRPNQQGLYVLPYLQSGHVLLLMILLIVAFVYYPGFPLTEAEDDVRLGLKIGLAITGLVNAGLSVLAYQSAGERRQPQLFWAFKTAILGNLAFNELRRNAPVFKEEEKTRSKKGKQST